MCAVFLLCLAILAVAQTPATAPAQDFIKAILKAKDTQETDSLLERSPALVTHDLWQALMTAATAAYYAQGADRALAIYQIALRVAARLPEPRSLATTHYYVGRTYSGAGRFREAIQAYLLSQDVFEAAGLRRDLLYLFSDLGTFYLQLENYDEAKKYAEKTLLLADELKDSSLPPGMWSDAFGVAGAHALLGALYRHEAKYSRAIAELEQAQALYQKLDGGSLRLAYYLADTLAELGRVYNEAGDNAQALDLLQQALTITKTTSQHTLTAGILNSIGVLYLEQEDYEQAEGFLRHSLLLYQALNNKTEATRTMLNLGVTEQRRGNFAEAQTHFQHCLEQATILANRDIMMAAGEGLGVVYREQKNFTEALYILRQSLSLAQSTKSPIREVELMWRTAEVYYATSDFNQAVDWAAQSHQLAQKLRLPKLTYLTAVTLGQAYLRQKKSAQAIEVLKQAINQMEALRDQVAGQEQERQLFFENKVTAYHLLTELMMEQGKNFEALLFAERAKGRVLFDVLHRGRKQFKEGGSDTIQRGQLPLLSQTDLSQLVADQETALVEYIVAKDRIFLFVVRKSPNSQNAEIRAYTINLSAAELNRRVGEFRQLLADRRSAFGAMARALYAQLLKPAEAMLQGVTTLCIIPDGILWEVPFQALRAASGRYLLEDYTISYAPSLHVLREMAKQNAPNLSLSLLALGNPAFDKQSPLLAAKTRGAVEALPEAEKEVVGLGRLFAAGKSKILLGAAADEGTFKSLASDYTTIHFATHGVLDNRQPLDSYLLLAKSNGQEDGLLEAREIMNLKLNAELIVLSACETARGKIGAGEGVIGLSWAFFLAGCRALVVSQWKVDSASTSALMVNFFGNFTRNNANHKVTKAEALRQAALKLMKNPSYQHPYYWAGFVMIGSNQ